MRTKFKKGDAAPDWLVNGLAHFGCDVVVEEILDRTWIYPQSAMKDDECVVRFPGTPEGAPFKPLVTVWTQPKS